MTGNEIVNKVELLNFPKNSYVVFGSCPMAIAGIREANDIDLFVSTALFRSLRKSGWQERIKGPGDRPLVHDVFEAHDNWAFGSYCPTLKELIATATLVRGVPFASLEAVRDWKANSKRSKDRADVTLIARYLADHRKR